jgi:hypothetical protein
MPRIQRVQALRQFAIVGGESGHGEGIENGEWRIEKEVGFMGRRVDFGRFGFYSSDRC